MENQTPGANEKKQAKQITKNRKKKPVKIVHFSNPMKINASASEFRALVQELTGQDAEIPEPSRFTPVALHRDDGCHGHQEAPEDETHSHAALQTPPMNPSFVMEGSYTNESSDLLYEQYFDEALFMPQFQQNVTTGLLPSSNLWVESVHVDDEEEDNGKDEE